jgi:polyamine oxidase
VAVRDATGRTEEGAHAAVTVPLGVLKNGSPAFLPSLPASRTAAIERLGFGYMEKVALLFERPFWREADAPHLLSPPPSQRTDDVGARDDAFGGGPVPVAEIFRSATHRVRGEERRRVRQLGVRRSCRSARFPVPSSQGGRRFIQGRPPYSAGAYSHIPPAATPADADLLGEPVSGLLFAGEHTQSSRLVYADGAMASGIREAKRLIGRASIQLSTS